MGRGSREIPPCCKRYGLPLYSASWVPLEKISTASSSEEAVEEEKNEEEERGNEAADDGKKKKGSRPETSDWKVVLGGGGGEGRSGVPNALLLSQFDVALRSLADQPIFRLGTEREVPYRMAVHPSGDGVLCSFPKSCRWFEWKLPESKGVQNLALNSSQRPLTQLEDVGLQLALAFSSEGSLLATGGEDGHLRVFRWPNMELILDQSDVNTSVKDLDFSSDGKFLVSLWSAGPCRVWDTTSCSVVTNLSRENGENFSFCRFSHSIGNDQILYTTAMQGQRGRIVSWSPVSWQRIGAKQIVRDPVSAFNVSEDGKLLAVGTIEGDIIIANCWNMRVRTVVKKAHLGLVTALVFKDSRALLSTSFDASVRVTMIEDEKNNGISMWIIFFVILLAVLVYYMKINGAV